MFREVRRACDEWVSDSAGGCVLGRCHRWGVFPAGRRSGRPQAVVARPAKYRDPASGATWTGRGKPPGWIRGKDREGFLIG